MAPGRFRFDHFILDPGERQLRHGDAPVELNARYLDALVLLVRERGRLVCKDRFFDEVWKGVPVTDEALTQCIKTLRRQLGDKAASPRFIETVPKHGYRFIAPVETENPTADAARSEADEMGAPKPSSWRHFLQLGAAGTIGGGAAGILVGLLYGFAGASQPLQAGMGAVSLLLVLACLSIAAGLVGGAGIGFGIAAAGFAADRPGPWPMVGGAVGGLIMGALAKLLGLDAFSLLLGRVPGDITGAAEGALVGGAIGLGTWLASRARVRPIAWSVAGAGAAGGAAGLILPSLGGRLMGGSLDLLAGSFPGSRLRLDPLGALFGEESFGPVTQTVTAGLEGLLFGVCVAGAMAFARRRSGDGV